MPPVVPEPFELVSLPWESQPGRWSLSLCLRGTFALVHGGPCEPLEPQVSGHTVDGSWDEANDKILHLADLAPFKPRADVLVIGHAWAPWRRPVRALIARVRVGELVKGVRVVGDRSWRWVNQRWVTSEPRPFTKMPLRWERAARSPAVPAGLDLQATPVEGAHAAPTFEPLGDGLPGLGPIPPGWPQRYGLVDEEALEWALSFAGGGPVTGAPPPRFPFGFFNVAPPDQQLDLIRPGVPLILEHLSEEHPVIATHLPTARPRVTRTLGGGRRAEIALRCDTVWIDTDRGTVTMLWRGLVDIEGPLDRPDLSFAVDGLPPGAAATGPAPRAPAVPTAPPGPSRLEQTQDVPIASVDRALAALPFGGGGHEEPASTIVDEGSTTQSGQRVAEALGGGGTLRLRPPATTAEAPPVPGPRPPPSMDRESLRGAARTEPVPTEPPRPTAARVEPARVEPPRVEPARVEPPRVEPARVEPARVEPPRAEPARVEPARVEPARATDAPVAPTPALLADPESIDLTTCAAIAAHLAEPGGGRPDVLGEHHLDEAGWSRLDRRWKQAIDQDARKGSTALLEAYDDAFLQALGRGGRPIGIAEYARITIAQRRGDLAEVLESLRFPRIELLRLTRVWTRRAKGDPALAAELKAATEAEEKRGP